MTPPLIGTICPACASPVTGRFCAECGASVDRTTCAGCATVLSTGAKFCHRCGLGAGARPLAGTAAASPAANGGGALPWTVAAIALLALAAFFVGQNFRGTRASPAAETAADSPALPVVGASQVPGAPGAVGPVDGGAARAPDISRLSPEERASMLFDRMTRLSEQGKTDSMQFFAPMALTAYEMLRPLNLDQRYDYGRIALMSGTPPLARAQADSILLQSPTHLLGLVLAAEVAAVSGDAAGRADYERRLLAAAPAERARSLPEYAMHRMDIDSAVARATRLARRPARSPGR